MNFENLESKSYSDFVPYYKLFRIVNEEKDKGVDISKLFSDAITSINVRQVQKGNVSTKPDTSNLLAHLPQDEMTLKFDLGLQTAQEFRLPVTSLDGAVPENNMDLAKTASKTKLLLTAGYSNIKSPYMPVIPVRKNGRLNKDFKLSNINDWVLELPMIREYKLFTGVVPMPNSVGGDQSGTYSTNWTIKLSSNLFNKKGTLTTKNVKPFTVSNGMSLDTLMGQVKADIFEAEITSGNVVFDFENCKDAKARSSFTYNYMPNISSKSEFLEVVCRRFDVAYHIIPEPKNPFQELWYFYKASNGLNHKHEDFNQAILDLYKRIDPDFSKRLEELNSSKFNKSIDTFALYLKHGDNLLDFQWGYHPKADSGKNASGTLVYKAVETDGQMVSYELDQAKIESYGSMLEKAGLIPGGETRATQTREYVQKMLSDNPERVIEFFKANFEGKANPEKFETAVGNTGTTKCSGKMRYAIPGLQCGTKVFFDVADHMKMFFSGILPNVYTLTEINNEITSNGSIWTQSVTFER